MFRGRYEHTIDSKGRVSLPAKFREVLNNSGDNVLVITNYDGCLVAYPLNEWGTIEEKVSSLPMMSKEVKSFQRFFISGASDCPIDKQGRIPIPSSLRKYANLEKDVVFLGLTKKIEIWNKKQWVEESARAEENVQNMGKELASFGI